MTPEEKQIAASLRLVASGFWPIHATAAGMGKWRTELRQLIADGLAVVPAGGKRPTLTAKGKATLAMLDGETPKKERGMPVPIARPAPARGQRYFVRTVRHDGCVTLSHPFDFPAAADRWARLDARDTDAVAETLVIARSEPSYNAEPDDAA
jgi:hypothetical protein